MNEDPRRLVTSINNTLIRLMTLLKSGAILRRAFIAKSLFWSEGFEQVLIVVSGLQVLSSKSFNEEVRGLWLFIAEA